MKILLIVAAALSLVSCQAYKKTVVCASDSQCMSSEFCVRQACMDINQLRIVAEVYAPEQGVIAVQKQSAVPQCRLDSDCDDGYDRCSKGACYNSEATANYHQQVSQLFAQHFGEVEVPHTAPRQCITDIQCIPGDTCVEGECLEYFTAAARIQDRVATYRKLNA